jgi:type II restriction/modification system DNA methylase subunit YeeA
MFEAPFSHVQKEVKPQREQQNDKARKEKWWLHGRSGSDMRNAMAPLSRYIVTPRVAKHRFFVWQPTAVWPDSRLFAICLGNSVAFGLLESRQHQVWSLAMASMHGVGNDPTYNAKSCFETFPFPAHLTPKDTAEWHGTIPTDCPVKGVAVKIAAAAEKLNSLREAWLNPPEWVDWVITPEEEKAGFPKRPVAKPGHEADVKKRTLTNLYNARPAWLDMAHKELDAAVAEAYGWMDYTPEMSDEEILRRLLALNLERSAKN